MSTTSSTPRSRPRTAAGRTQVRRDHETSASPDLGSRRGNLGKTAGVVVMAVLMGLTSWVVASISTWLVPVYVTAMILIFVAPRGHHTEGRERAGTKPEDFNENATRASGPTSAGSSLEAPVSLAIHGSSEVPASETEPPGSVTKPRRVRGRGRKPARPPGAGPAVTPAAATWIQVAPGKFVRADSQDQGLTAPEPEAPVEVAKAPTGVVGSPPEPLEEEDSTTASTLADAPDRANLIEPGPSSERAVPFNESVTEASPQQDSPLNGLEQTATSAAGEYGIAPSTFGPDLREARLEETNHEQDQTGSSISPRHVAEALAHAGIEPLPQMAREFPCTGNPKAMPEVATAGLPPAWTGSDENRPARGRVGSPCGWIRFTPGPRTHGVSGFPPRSRLSRCLRNGRSHPLCWSPAGLGTMASRRSRTLARRNFGRSRQPHRRFQPRSPPARS